MLVCPISHECRCGKKKTNKHIFYHLSTSTCAWVKISVVNFEIKLIQLLYSKVRKIKSLKCT